MKQYHRVYAEINIDNIKSNLKAIKEYVGLDKEIMAVIKADGYGHGAVPIARQLYKAGICSIGVATLQEAIALRKINIDIPIIVLGYFPKEECEDLIRYTIIPTVFKFSTAKNISDTAVKLGKVAKIHIKIDTGMTRLGFMPKKDSIEEIAKINLLPNIEIEGIFTHFAQADSEDKTYTNNQIAIFKQFILNLEKRGINILKIHACNSAGIINYKEAHFNMVRAGIALYGLYPSKNMENSQLHLKPSLSLKSNIIYLKEVEKGVAISYDSTYITSCRCKIATIPVGYGDGYPRSLSSKGRVIIRGQYAPIVGRICMDQFMVDVTHIKDVSEGDEVVLIGNQGENAISVEEVADIDGTINYEIVCQLGKRIPRVYYQDNEIVDTVDYF